MPKVTRDMTESIEEVVGVGEKHIPDAKQCALFFASLDKALNKDGKGRVSFRPYVIAWRRRYFAKAFNGNNIRELAKSMNVSEETVENDLRWLREQERLKRNGRKVA